MKLFSRLKRKRVQKVEEKGENQKAEGYLKREDAEGSKEKKVTVSQEQKIIKRTNKAKDILTKNVMIGRTRGKKSHGPRGNKDE
ncbi:MAG: hypothetical protein KAU12_00425 [Candidatus Omnitrophica bacterium]|nr:hypothetical protein [Candidatus Omnitrophota bacterium]